MLKLHQEALVWTGRVLGLALLYTTIGIASALGGGLGISANEVRAHSRAAGGDTSEVLKVHPAVDRLFREAAPGERVKAWVLFVDKGMTSPAAGRAALDEVAATYNPRAIQRRRDRRLLSGMFDWHDLAVPQQYIDAVSATGARVHVISKWVNGVSVRATRAQIDEVAELPFVDMVQPVRRGRKVTPTDVQPVTADAGSARAKDGSGARTLDYGQADAQLAQMNLISVHDLGYTGAGVFVGILDTGFERSHEAFNDPGHPVEIVAEWDFVDNDPDTSMEPDDPPGQHNHGTYILGTLGAYKPGSLIGGAFDASFILCKTEDTMGEYPAEEDNFVAGLEFIESHGGDMATSSLGYVDWYSQDELDGMTAVTTIAVNVATGNGMHCCSAAGNDGHDGDPMTSHLIAPSDALRLIGCGAVQADGRTASFSSDGPAADGRVKPELLARGVNTQTVSPYDPTGYTGVGGTSLSTPLVAATVACLIQAHPTWTVDQMRAQLFHTAIGYANIQTFDPAFIRGYGIVNALAALAGDCNGNAVDDETDIAEGTSGDCNENGVPDECDTNPAGDYVDCNENNRPDECDLDEGVSQDGNGNGIPDECEIPPAEAPIEPSWPHSARKNRYISFTPNNGSNPVAFQVELVDGPGLPGVLGWIGAPDANDICRIARVPATRVWPEAVLHVGDCAIVPVATYEVRATGNSGSNFSDGFAVGTIRQPAPKAWGDIAGIYTGQEWTGPDGTVTFDDVTAAVQTFLIKPNAPHFTWVDVDGEIPNQVVNFSDIFRIVQAFKSLPYPFLDPVDCP